MANFWLDEGEVKAYLNGDEDYPTLCSTGTEDCISSTYGQGLFDNLYQGNHFVQQEKNPSHCIMAGVVLLNIGKQGLNYYPPQPCFWALAASCFGQPLLFLTCFFEQTFLCGHSLSAFFSPAATGHLPSAFFFSQHAALTGSEDLSHGLVHLA
ncbi:MAG: DUF2961 domain-containing protein [Planctomycetota bacterium]|nr:MAG: DUF2961 domain-containing protein [Planctomycetota bacterium]